MVQSLNIVAHKSVVWGFQVLGSANIVSNEAMDDHDSGTEEYNWKMSNRTNMTVGVRVEIQKC